MTLEERTEFDKQARLFDAQMLVVNQLREAKDWVALHAATKVLDRISFRLYMFSDDN